MLLEDHKMTRENVWLNAWLMYSKSRPSPLYSTADFWANHCLEEFDKRFPQYLPKDHVKGTKK